MATCDLHGPRQAENGRGQCVKCWTLAGGRRKNAAELDAHLIAQVRRAAEAGPCEAHGANAPLQRGLGRCLLCFDEVGHPRPPIVTAFLLACWAL